MTPVERRCVAVSISSGILAARQPRHPTTIRLRAIDALLDELVGLHARHDKAMADALRQRLQDIARHTHLVEQIGDHFRQPLQALALFVAGMQPAKTCVSGPCSGRCCSSLMRLNELLDGRLEMARFDVGAIEPTATDLIASDLFGRERAAIEVDATRLGVDVRWRGGRLPLRTDPALFGDVLHRLVGNAVLSTPNGRVLVAMRRRGSTIRPKCATTAWAWNPRSRRACFEEITRLPGHPGYGLAWLSRQAHRGHAGRAHRRPFQPGPRHLVLGGTGRRRGGPGRTDLRLAGAPRGGTERTPELSSRATSVSLREHRDPFEERGRDEHQRSDTAPSLAFLGVFAGAISLPVPATPTLIVVGSSRWSPRAIRC